MVKGWRKAQRKFDEMGPERVVIICLQLKTISDINSHIIFFLSKAIVISVLHNTLKID